MWTSEALFVARLDPWTPAAGLDADRLRGLVDWLHRMLRLSVDHSVQSSTGDPRPGRNTHVHGRHRSLCHRCGAPIRVEPLSPAADARVIFFCPRCQRRPD